MANVIDLTQEPGFRVSVEKQKRLAFRPQPALLIVVLEGAINCLRMVSGVELPHLIIGGTTECWNALQLNYA